MSVLEIKLSKKAQEFLESQVAAGHCRDASELIEKLVSAEEKRQARARVEALLLEGLHSGDPMPLTAENLQTLFDEVKAERARRGNGTP